MAHVDASFVQVAGADVGVAVGRRAGWVGSEGERPIAWCTVHDEEKTTPFLFSFFFFFLVWGRETQVQTLKHKGCMYLLNGEGKKKKPTQTRLASLTSN